MKITKEELMKVIEEEISMIEQDEQTADAPPEAGDATMSDVGKVLTYIEKINNYKEL